MEFETAWSPPTEAMDALLSEPGLLVAYLMYNEAGCDFIGLTIIDSMNGVSHIADDLSEVFGDADLPDHEEDYDLWEEKAIEARNDYFYYQMNIDGMGNLGFGG